MLDILSITGPIYIAIALGFLMTRIGIFTKENMQIFGKFAIYLALPALLFKTLSQRPLNEIINIGYLAAYLAGTMTIIGLGYLLCRRLAGLSPIKSTIYVMGMSCSNSGFVGYPILLLSMAPVAGVSLALNMTVENLVIIPLMLALAERDRITPGLWYHVVGQSLARLSRNPMIIGLVTGFLVSATGVKLPEIITRTVNIFAMSSVPVALFVIGGALVGLPIKGMGLQVAPIVIGKLILHPLAVFLAILALPVLGFPALDASLSMAAVVMAATPMMSIYTILAQIYGEEALSAAAMLIGNAVSFFTLSGLLWLFKYTPIG